MPRAIDMLDCHQLAYFTMVETVPIQGGRAGPGVVCAMKTDRFVITNLTLAPVTRSLRHWRDPHDREARERNALLGVSSGGIAPDDVNVQEAICAIRPAGPRRAWPARSPGIWDENGSLAPWPVAR